MFLLGSQFGQPRSWIRNEIKFPGDFWRGKRGQHAKMVQEWLNLHGHGLAIDGDFGAITERNIAAFQKASRLSSHGRVDAATFAALTAPMRAALAPLARPPRSFGATVLAFGKQHLAQHPREIGGQNRGPWVRMYMQGHQGRDWPWCAGFVTFLMEQAAQQRGERIPILGSFSCDTLAAQGKDAGRFLSERGLDTGDISEGALFLVRRTATDWTHVGLVEKAEAGLFSTLEGNTNDDGHREGYEVCTRHRGYRAKDFIRL
ncbi:MAG: peptidoglycan-binding domain-containing protein [Pseudomonadota bacterium]